MNALVPTNIKLPAHLTARIGQSSALGDITGGIASGFKRISIRGSRWRIKDGKTETVLPSHTLRAVIVGASPNTSKLFYKGTYDPDADNKAPDCYSADGIRPAADAVDPQAQQCATCEQNQWGSKVTEGGKKMKACADQKKLAIIAADDDSQDPDVYGFTVTPAALTSFKHYADLLASKGFPPELVITEMSFDTDAAYPKAEFKFGGFVEEHMVPVIDGLIDTPHVNEIIGKSTQMAKVIEAPKPKPSPVKEKKVEVVQELTDDDVEIIPAPTKTKGFGAAAPAPKAPPPAPKAPPVVQSSKLTDDINDILNSMQEEDDD